MASLRTTVRTLILFLFPRHPFLNAITLLMLLAERAKTEDYPPLEPKIIYGHLGIFIVCGVCMSFNFKRREASLVHAGQLVYFAISIYTNVKLGYSQWLRARMALQGIGVAGFTVLYAFYSMRKPRSQPLRRLAETLIGLYLGAALYLTLESPEDKKAFLSLVPGGSFTLYLYALFVGAACLCYLPGLYVYDVTQALLPVLCISTVFVDCNINYWTKKRGMHFWNQIRLLEDSICIIMGVLMLLSCSVQKPPLSEEELRLHEQRGHVHTD